MSLTVEEAATILTKSSLPALKGEHPVTKSVVAAIPSDKADYRPDGIVRSALDLAWHICASELRFLEAVAAGSFDFSGAARPESIRTPAQIVDWYAERFEKDYERLKGLSG